MTIIFRKNNSVNGRQCVEMVAWWWFISTFAIDDYVAAERVFVKVRESGDARQVEGRAPGI